MADLPASKAKAWMVKAWRDLETARRAAGGEPPFYDLAVYLCQQTAEKSVKAFPDDLRFRPEPAPAGGAAMKHRLAKVLKANQSNDELLPEIWRIKDELSAARRHG